MSRCCNEAEAAEAEVSPGAEPQASPGTYEGLWLSARHGRLLVQGGTVLTLNGRYLGWVKGDIWVQATASSQRRLLRQYQQPCLLLWQEEDSWADTWDRRLLEAIDEAFRVAHQHFPDLPMSYELLEQHEVLPLTVALCTASKDRLWQLKTALPLTLLFNWPFRFGSLKVHVVDFGSDDRLVPWLQKWCRVALDCGLLELYQGRGEEVRFFHASVAKNSSHAVAEEDILVNLDADNIAGPGFVEDVLRHMQSGVPAICYNTDHVPGTCGRVCLRRGDFWALRGYDEDSEPMGAQDVDLYLRVGLWRRKPGLWERSQPLMSLAIPNTLQQKMHRTAAPRAPWHPMSQRNWTSFQARRDEGALRRNLTRQLGVPLVHIVFRYHRGSVHVLQLPVERLPAP